MAQDVQAYLDKSNIYLTPLATPSENSKSFSRERRNSNNNPQLLCWLNISARDDPYNVLDVIGNQLNHSLHSNSNFSSTEVPFRYSDSVSVKVQASTRSNSRGSNWYRFTQYADSRTCCWSRECGRFNAELDDNSVTKQVSGHTSSGRCYENCRADAIRSAANVMISEELRGFNQAKDLSFIGAGLGSSDRCLTPGG